jgi:thiamine-phosphate pyrophosphorylase
MIRYYVTDRRRTEAVQTAQRMIAAGVDLIQIREKDLEAAALLDLAAAIVEAARASATRILVNDRLDVALASGADGVHLPANGLPAALVRPHIGLVGVSTHTLEEVRSAERDGADFVVFGPIFDTPGKTAIGLAPLREACRAVRIPVLAIGGMTEENAPRAIDAGAQGIAGIRMFQSKSR